MPSPEVRPQAGVTNSRGPVGRWRSRSLSAFQWAVLLLLILTVSRIHAHFGVLRALRPALLLAAGALGLALLNPAELNLKRILNTWPAKVILAIVVIAGLSAPFGISLGASATFIIDNYSRVLLFALLLAGAIRTGADLSKYVWAYVIASGILVWMALFVFGLSRSYGSSVARLGDMYTYDSNDLGVVLLAGLPLAALLAQSSRGYKRWGAIIVAIGIGAAIARTGSRGAFVGLVVVGAALLVIVKGVSVAKRAAFVGVAAIALLVMAPPGYWTQMETLVEPTTDYNWTSKNGRKQIAIRGFGYMMSYPVFGLGINNFGRAEGTISTKAANHVPGTGLMWTAPHNTYVQVGAELGVIAVLLWVGLFVGGVRWMMRLRRRAPPSWAAGNEPQRFLYYAPAYFAVAFLGFAVSSAFVSFAYLDLPYILAVFAAGLVASLNRVVQMRARGGPRRQGASRRTGLWSKSAGHRPGPTPVVPSSAGPGETELQGEPISRE